MDLSQAFRLDHRTAVIVGGAGHLGSAIADGLAQLGADVALVDRDEQRMLELSEGIRERRGRRVSLHRVELEALDTVALLTSLEREHPGVDLLVHAAALVGTSPLPGWTTSFEDQSAATWRRALEVNLTSAFLLTQALAPSLRSSQRGAVVLVGSIYAHVGVDLSIYGDTGMGNPAAYGASKGGLMQFMRWAATVLAPDIRVNAVSPGGIARGQATEFVTEYVRRTPMRRMATEDDIVGAVGFLCSDASAYITGHDLIVDGGWTAW